MVTNWCQDFAVEVTNPLKRIKSGGDAQHWERTASYLQSSLCLQKPATAIK